MLLILLNFRGEILLYVLTHLTGKTKYPNLRLGEVHYLDYADLIALKEIESALAEQLKAGETVDGLLAKLFFEILKRKVSASFRIIYLL